MCSYLSTKRFAIENLGCAKNQVDAEIMAASLMAHGWTFCKENPQDADLVIVNTCGFIASAKKEAVDTLLELTTQYPDKQIIAAGCMAQRYSEELQQSIPELSAVFGNSAPELISELLEHPLEGQIYRPEGLSSYPQRQELFSFKGSAYVKIAEGCDNRCRYCAIPIIRGGVKSRPLGDILEEIRILRDRGIFEFNLVAQDLAHYGKDRKDHNFMDLLKGISDLEGDFWVRLLYIHPDHFPMEILPLLQKDQRILPYFDIPFQHCSPKVLRNMGRRGDSQTYLKLIKDLREALPNGVFRSTFLTGFNGEDKRTMKELRDFQEEARFDWLGCFIYSPEEDTPAYKESKGLKGTLERRRGTALKKSVEEAQQKIMTENLKRFLGNEYTFLIEEEIPEEDMYLGRGYMQAPEVDGLTVIHGENLKPGDRVKAKVIRVNGADLEAALVESDL